MKHPMTSPFPNGSPYASNFPALDFFPVPPNPNPNGSVPNPSRLAAAALQPTRTRPSSATRASKRNAPRRTPTEARAPAHWRSLRAWTTETPRLASWRAARRGSDPPRSSEAEAERRTERERRLRPRWAARSEPPLGRRRGAGARARAAARGGRTRPSCRSPSPPRRGRPRRRARAAQPPPARAWGGASPARPPRGSARGDPELLEGGHRGRTPASDASDAAEARPRGVTMEGCTRAALEKERRLMMMTRPARGRSSDFRP